MQDTALMGQRKCRMLRRRTMWTRAGWEMGLWGGKRMARKKVWTGAKLEGKGQQLEGREMRERRQETKVKGGGGGEGEEGSKKSRSFRVIERQRCVGACTEVCKRESLRVRGDRLRMSVRGM